jgi:hypothetical protein
MRLTVEVYGKFDHAADASKLLYAPLEQKLTFRESRRYSLEYTGDGAALQEFLTHVLAHDTSHALCVGEAPALAEGSFILDYGMKPGALDLEQQTIVNYYGNLENPSFALEKLSIERRIYVYGATPAELPSLAEKLVRDVVNTAIHRYKITLA